MKKYDEYIQKIKLLQGTRWTTQSALAEKAGVAQAQVSRLLGVKEKPNFAAGLAILDAIGAKIVFPDEDEVDTTREIVFTDPRLTGVTQYNGKVAWARPRGENYLAVPLVAENVAAGPGKTVADNEVLDWVVVYRFDPAIRHTSNLVAVRIGTKEQSMVPTLHPGDIILVDKSDKRPDPAGKIVLASEPVETGESPKAMVKRVSAHHEKNDLLLIFTSDNPDQNTYHPRPYYLKQDYNGEIERAIAGRVVWAWSDMTKK